MPAHLAPARVCPDSTSSPTSLRRRPGGDLPGRTIAGPLTLLLLGLGGALFAAPEGAETDPAALDERIWSIPRLEGIRIDGDAADWADRGFHLPALPADAEQRPTAEDFSVQAWIGWNEQGLLYRVEVRDDAFVESENPGALFENDSVEVFLLPERRSRDSFQLTLSPGLDPRHGKMRTYVWDYRSDEALQARQPARHEAAVRAGDGRYVAEMLLPWAMHEIVPAPGLTIAGRIFVNDVDPGERRVRHAWTTASQAWGGRDTHHLRLAAEPSPGPALAVWAGYSLEGHTYLHAWADPSRAGQRLEARVAGCADPFAVVLAAESGRAAASLRLPLPDLSAPPPPIRLTLAGAEVPACFPPDGREQLREVLDGLFFWPQWISPEERARWGFLEIACPTPVFTGDRFPAFGFADPVVTTRLTGPCQIDVHYYDAAHRLVATPTAPGRYGAVVQVRFDYLGEFTLYRTLYRLAEGAEPPAEATATDGAAAIRLAARDEDPQGSSGLTPEGLDAEWWHAQRHRLGTARVYPVEVYRPKAVSNDPDHRWPLLVFLHGSGGGLNPDLFWESCRDFLRRGPGQPPSEFIVAFLRNRENLVYEAPAVLEAIAGVQRDHPVDPRRIYLCGFSLGGFGTWDTALHRPEVFAAIAPIGGGRADPAQAARLRHLPIWVFNGENDPSTTVEEATPMVEALRAAGADLQFTIFPGAQHPESLVLASSHAPLYAWFLRQVNLAP